MKDPLPPSVCALLEVVMVGVVAPHIQHTERAEDRFDDLPSEQDQCRGHYPHVADHGRTAFSLIHPCLMMDVWRTTSGCMVVQMRLPS